MIQLGVEAKDKITGFRGIITGRAQYLYGCDQYVIVPPIDAAMKLGEAQWFDEGRIEIIGIGINAEDVSVEVPGGPQRDAPKKMH